MLNAESLVLLLDKRLEFMNFPQQNQFLVFFSIVRSSYNLDNALFHVQKGINACLERMLNVHVPLQLLILALL